MNRLVGDNTNKSRNSGDTNISSQDGEIFFAQELKAIRVKETAKNYFILTRYAAYNGVDNNIYNHIYNY